MSLVADQVKHSEAIAISDNRFAVDQKRAGGQCRNGSDNERKARCEIITVPRDEPDTRTISPGHDAKAIMLDFVNPAGPGGRDFGGRGQTRLNYPQPGAGTLTQRHGRNIMRVCNYCDAFLLRAEIAKEMARTFRQRTFCSLLVRGRNTTQRLCDGGEGRHRLRRDGKAMQRLSAADPVSPAEYPAF